MATSTQWIPVPKNPGIYIKGNRHVVIYRVKGKRRSKSFRSLTEARDFKAKAHLGDVAAHSSRTLLTAYAATWLDSYSGRTTNGLRDSTRDSYKDALDRIIIPFYQREMPSLKLAELAPSDLRALISHLASEGYAPSSIRRTFAPMRALVNTAFEDGLIARNPTHGLRVIIPNSVASNGGKAAAIKRKSKHGGKPKPKLTAEQTKRLLSEIPAEHADLVFLLASTGVRISEALSLRWRDFVVASDSATDRDPVAAANSGDDALDGGASPMLVITESKTAAGVRSLALSPETARRLTRRRSMVEHSADSDPIFASMVGSKIEAHNFRQRVFKPAAERAGIEWATPHSLRHGLATLMASHGYNAAQIASQLGHADGGVLALRTYVKTPVVSAPDFIDLAFAQQ
jgi:integrase